MSNKNKKNAQGISIDPLFIDEAGLVRYGTEMPLTDSEGNQHRTPRAGERFGGGVIQKFMRTPADDLQINTAANLLIDWLLETYREQNINPPSEDISLPGVL